MSKEKKVDLKITLKQPKSLFDSPVRYLPSLIKENEITFVTVDHPLYEPWLKAWKASIRDDYGKDRTYGSGKFLKEHPIIPEIEFFVLVRKNWFNTEGPTDFVEIGVQQWAMKLLEEYLWKSIERFQTEALIGFAEAFKVAVEREDCLAYFNHDYYKILRSWVILTVENYTEGTGKVGLFNLPKEEFDREIQPWIPSSREIINDLKENEREASYKKKEADYSRNDRIKQILRALDLPYKREK